MDPLLLAAAVAAWGGLVALVLFVSPAAYVLITIAYVIFLPKLGVVSVPGSHIALRGEDALIALLLVRVLVDLGMRRFTLPPLARKVTWWLLALLPIGAIGILVGIQTGSVANPLLGALFLFRRYEYFVLFLAGLMYFTGRPGSRTVLLRMLELSVYFQFVVSVLQTAGVMGAWPMGTYLPHVTLRVYGMFSGPYELAAYLAILLPLFVWRLCNGRSRVSSIAAIIVIFATLWLSQSRVAIVGAAVVVVVLLWKWTRHRWGTFTIVAPLSIVALALMPQPQVTGDPTRDSRFSTLDPVEMWNATVLAYQNRDYSSLAYFRSIDSDVEDRSFALRIDKWFSYMDGLFKYNPLFGLGPSSGGANMDSNYVRIPIEFGIVGLIVFVALLVVVGRLARSANDGPWRAMVVWGGVGLLIQAIFIDVFEASKVAEVYWLLLGVALTLGPTGEDTTKPLVKTLRRSDRRAFARSM